MRKRRRRSQHKTEVNQPKHPPERVVNGNELPIAPLFAEAERAFKAGYKPALWDVVWSCEVMGGPKPPWARDALIAFAHEYVQKVGRGVGRSSTARFATQTRNMLHDYEIFELVNLYTEGGEWCGRFSTPHPPQLAVGMVAKELHIERRTVTRACAKAKERLKTALPYFSYLLQQHRYD